MFRASKKGATNGGARWTNRSHGHPDDSDRAGGAHRLPTPTPVQLNSTSRQLQPHSASEASAPCAPTQLAATQRQRPRASHCKRHLLTKVHL